MPSETEMKRLRWLCTHRALREMDVLLENFLDRHFARLNAGQKAAFATLAGMEDIELRQLVTGRSECTDPGQKEILAMLRDIRTA
ncbi:MAG: succinate dehydrogenase assembly factor 2 [Candidatus Accumulibacter sp.]|jgi:succinate dehydrogenase flavin-adding protein (antitoxin of CptAB toxin-antitoxin module)|nr:succinate dehydrogenase assembly factor 2 [Accumulibacter sp.]